MNEHLKFSWGHIIAFLGLIFICYTTFVGVCYLTNGNFLYAGIGTFIVFLVCLFVFIGAQQLKATDHKFDRNIKIERILVWGSPIFYLLMVFPMCHAWTVNHRSDKIVSNFESAINSSKALFDEYDEYADKRVANYEANLRQIVANKNNDAAEYRKCHFSGNNDAEEIQTRVKVLDTQIRSGNYAKLKEAATSWIESAGNGASTWNVFLMGNIKQVKSAIQSWQVTLTKLSTDSLPGENYNGQKVERFDPQQQIVPKVCKQLDSLSGNYTKIEAPSVVAIICAVLCYLFLIFPYLIQDRHSKSTYRFIGREEGSGKKGGFAPTPAKSKPAKAPAQPRPTAPKQNTKKPQNQPKNNGGNNGNAGGDDDFGMFTLN